MTRPIAGIVESAPAVDVDAAAEHIIVALSGERDAATTAKRHEGLATAARETEKLRRLEVGRWLLKVRPTWPPSGPKAKGWSEFLARVKLDDSTAVRYMAEARPSPVHGDPSSPQDSAHERDVSQTGDDDEPFDVFGQERDTPPFRQMTEGEWIQGLGRLDPDVRRRIMHAAGPLPAPAPALALTPDPTTANVHGGSGERRRGSYCTPKKWAHAVGPFDLDPFSNKRSHIAAVDRCMLENGGDGLVTGEPGSYRVGADGAVKVATASTRTWWQPPYERGFIERVIKHYGHTRFCALLRFAPDTEWFAAMWPIVTLVAVPMERIPFETPDGIEIVGADEGEDKGAPFPHVFYYSDPRDVTEEIARTCILLTRYEALRLVR